MVTSPMRKYRSWRNRLLGDERLQVLVGGAHDAHVDRNFLAPADALDDAVLQEAQQLGLQRQRHVADLVEEQRAAARRSRSCRAWSCAAPVNAPFS